MNKDKNQNLGQHNRQRESIRQKKTISGQKELTVVTCRMFWQACIHKYDKNSLKYIGYLDIKYFK